MRRKRFIVIFICLFLLTMVGFACGILAPVPEAIASGLDSSELLQGGRDLTITDWVDHLSVLLMVSLLTIAAGGKNGIMGRGGMVLMLLNAPAELFLSRPNLHFW